MEVGRKDKSVVNDLETGLIVTWAGISVLLMWSNRGLPGPRCDLDTSEASKNLILPSTVVFRANESLSSDMSVEPDVRLSKSVGLPGVLGVAGVFGSLDGKEVDMEVDLVDEILPLVVISEATVVLAGSWEGPTMPRDCLSEGCKDSDSMVPSSIVRENKLVSSSELDIVWDAKSPGTKQLTGFSRLVPC